MTPTGAPSIVGRPGKHASAGTAGRGRRKKPGPGGPDEEKVARLAGAGFPTRCNFVRLASAAGDKRLHLWPQRSDSGQARLKGVGEFRPIEILADENEGVLARLTVPFPIKLGVEEHMHSLENEPLG